MNRGCPNDSKYFSYESRITMNAINAKKCTPFFVMLLFTLAMSGCDLPQESYSETRSGDSGVTSDAAESMTFERMSPLVEAYRDIANILNLSKAEQRQFELVFEKHKSIFTTWYANEWAELKSIQKKAMDAAKERNLAKMRQLNANGGKQRVAELHQQQREMQKAFEQELLATVPMDKLDQWKAHRITSLLLEFLQPLDLSEEQTALIRDQSLQVIRSNQKENWQGYGTDQLEKRFAKTIVHDDQQDAFLELQKKNRLRMLRWNNYQ